MSGQGAPEMLLVRYIAFDCTVWSEATSSAPTFSIFTPVTAEAAAIPDIVAASTQPAFSPQRVQSPARTRLRKPLSPGASRWNTLPVVEST